MAVSSIVEAAALGAPGDRSAGYSLETCPLSSRRPELRPGVAPCTCARVARGLLGCSPPLRGTNNGEIGHRRWATARTSAASASRLASANAPARTKRDIPQFGLISTDLRRLSIP